MPKITYNLKGKKRVGFTSVLKKLNFKKIFLTTVNCLIVQKL